MSGWRVDTPSAAARLARSRPPSRGRRAGREGHLASVSRAPNACRSSPRRTRREAATATSSSWARASSGASCARGGSTYVRDARRALGLGFFFQTTTPPFGVSRARFFAIPADRLDPPRPARPSRRPRVVPAAFSRGDREGSDQHRGRARASGVPRRLAAAEISRLAGGCVSLCRVQRASQRERRLRRRGPGGSEGVGRHGGFVFTSSTAVYAGKDGEECDESTPEFAVGENPRADRLLQAEASVLEAGGAWFGSRACTTPLGARTCTS